MRAVFRALRVKFFLIPIIYSIRNCTEKEIKMEFSKIEIGKKYRIIFNNDGTPTKAICRILKNSVKRKFLKFKTKKEEYKCAYNDIIKVQSLNKFRLMVLSYTILGICCLAGALEWYINPQYHTCGTYTIGIQPHQAAWECQYGICKCTEISCSTRDKPVIYLYPEKATNVTVELGYPENTTHTYPKYNGAWQVQAAPDGNLTDLATGRHYYALYWEGINTNSPYNMTEGFIVKGKDSIAFLEEKLAQLGLTEREAEEFIIYWLPKLEKAPYNYIRFQTQEEQDRNMPLKITPTPQTIIRVMMEFANLDNDMQITEQVLPAKPQRNGFTVVEWGGTEISM